MPGVLRLKGGQLASALVRPRRLREPGATPTKALRTVPVRARKGPWEGLVVKAKPQGLSPVPGCTQLPRP